MSSALPVREETCASERYARRVNPEWVRLLNLLEMNVRYQRCLGAELFTSDGRRIVDFLSGYCVHAPGQNHPHAVRALERELERCGPAMIQTHVANRGTGRKTVSKGGRQAVPRVLRIVGK
jgi:4-aminobutyrate aminotransferase-like enzyme